MIDVLLTIDNFVKNPMPILDDTPQGYHLEERLQVSGKSAADEKQVMVEFNLGTEYPDTPGEDRLTEWLESGELLHAYCLNVVARPFVQKEDEESRKKYRRVGKEVLIDDKIAHLDTMIVFNGYTLVPVAEGKDVVEAIKQVHGAYKRRQRDYLTRRNAEKLQERMDKIPEQVEQMKQRKAERDAQAKAKSPAADPTATSRRRNAN